MRSGTRGLLTALLCIFAVACAARESGPRAEADSMLAAAHGTERTLLTAGERHGCAITSDGAISCFGENGSGQRGDRTIGLPDEDVDYEDGIRPDGFQWPATQAA